MTPHFYKIILPQWILAVWAAAIFVTDFQWVFLGYIFLGIYGPGILGNTIGFHRYLTHQSFEVNRFWHYILISLGSLTGQGSAIFWTALHLHHHRNSDNEKDVHSPKKGFFASTILWQLRGHYDTMPGLIAPRKLYRDPFIKFLHHHYYKVYWAVGAGLALIDLHFFLFFFCFGAFFMMSLIDNLSNFFMHWDRVGYTNFQTKDNSRNVALIAYLTLGAGWHNNHHHDPKNYRFGYTEREYDLGARIVELIRKHNG